MNYELLIMNFNVIFVEDNGAFAEKILCRGDSSVPSQTEK